jgi:hypothetical protein
MGSQRWQSRSDMLGLAHVAAIARAAVRTPSRQNVVSVLQSGHNVCSFAQYVEKLLDTLSRAGEYFDREAPMKRRLE